MSRPPGLLRVLSASVLLTALLAASSALASATATLSQAVANADRLPDGEGKDDVAGTCTVCHALTRVLQNRLDAAGWQLRIANHRERGLVLSPEEAVPLVKYLSTYFGPWVNINEAAAAELSRLPAVDEPLARAIVEHREKNGPFKKIDDLTKVKGVSSAIYDKVKNRITIAGVVEGSASK